MTWLATNNVYKFLHQEANICMLRVTLFICVLVVPHAFGRLLYSTCSASTLILHEPFNLRRIILLGPIYHHVPGSDLAETSDEHHVL